MSHANPPPQRIPLEYKKKSREVRDYEERQKEALRLLFENQSGSRGTNAPTESDEFSQRYTLLIC